MDPSTSGIQSAVTTQGSTLAIDIVVTDADQIGAFEFMVSFDPIQAHFGGWQLGPFLGSTGRNIVCLPLITENTVRLGCGSKDPPPPDGPSGSGVLATITFDIPFPVTVCFPLLLVETATVYGDALPTSAGGTGCATRPPPSTSTPTPSSTAMPNTPTLTPSPSPSPSPTRTRTPTKTAVPTESPAATSTVSAGNTPTAGPPTATPPKPPAATASSVPHTPVTPGCPHPRSYWRQQLDAWPVGSLTLGEFTYSRLELLGVLQLPDASDASVSLAQALIAAKLNIAAGEYGDVSDLMARADAALARYQARLPLSVDPGTWQGQGMLWIAAALEHFNNSCEVLSAQATRTAIATGPRGFPSTGERGLPGGVTSGIITALALLIAVLLGLIVREYLHDDM